MRQGYFHPENGSLAVSSITPLTASAHLQIHRAQLHHSEIHSSDIIDSPSITADYLVVKRSADFQGDVHVDGDLTVHGMMNDYDGDEDDTYDNGDDDSDKNNIDYMSLSIFLRCSQGR